MTSEDLSYAKMPRKDLLSIRAVSSPNIEYYQVAFLIFTCHASTVVCMEEHILVAVGSSQRKLIQMVVDSSGYEELEWVDPT